MDGRPGSLPRRALVGCKCVQLESAQSVQFSTKIICNRVLFINTRLSAGEAVWKHCLLHKCKIAAVIASPHRDPAPRRRRPSVCPPAGGPQAGGRQGGCLSLSGPFAWLCRALRRLPHRVAPRRARGAATAAPTPAPTPPPTCGPSPGHGGAALPLRVPLPVSGALSGAGGRLGFESARWPRDPLSQGCPSSKCGGRAADAFTGSSPWGGRRRPADGEDGGGGRDSPVRSVPGMDWKMRLGG